MEVTQILMRISKRIQHDYMSNVLRSFRGYFLALLALLGEYVLYTDNAFVVRAGSPPAPLRAIVPQCHIAFAVKHCLP